MNAQRPANVSASASSRWGSLLAVCLIVALAAAVRFDRLGERSLWLDEFSTWHVSRMDLAESLRWGPERTVPPLYQLCLRALTDQPHPPEWLLRLPAAVAAGLAVLAGWWLGRRLGGPAVGLGLALLLACNHLQIHYGQEARPYSLLVLGSTLSVLLWQQLVTQPTRRTAAAYVAVTTLTAYAHFLVAFTLVAQTGWWVQGELRQPNRRRLGHAVVAQLATVVLCVPLMVRTLVGRSEISTALAWIEPVTATRALTMLAEVTYGYGWLVLLWVALLLWGAWRAGWKWPGRTPTDRSTEEPGGDGSRLLIWWLGAAWLGPFLFSLLAMPLMVTRYALPAAVPGMLFPLLVARRLHRHAPLALAGLAVALSIPAFRAAQALPPLGFRELISFLQDRADLSTAAVVHAIDGVDPQRVELERLAFRYYPLPGTPVRDWLVNQPPAENQESVLDDPRRLYVVTFLADPLPAIRKAGRRIEPFVFAGHLYAELAFGQYQLLKVAPLLHQSESGSLFVP